MASAFKVWIQMFSLSIVLSPTLFQIFSKSKKINKLNQVNKPEKFAIDLRSPEELEEEIQNELDSEA